MTNIDHERMLIENAVHRRLSDFVFTWAEITNGERIYRGAFPGVFSAHLPSYIKHDLELIGLENELEVLVSRYYGTLINEMEIIVKGND